MTTYPVDGAQYLSSNRTPHDIANTLSSMSIKEGRADNNKKDFWSLKRVKHVLTLPECKLQDDSF